MSPLHAAIAAAVLACSPAHSDGGPKWEIDRKHTNILFFVDHLGFSTMLGEFRRYECSLVLDESDFTRSRVSARIEVESVATDNPDLDHYLTTESFFDGARFPSLTFESRRVRRTGVDRLAVDGDLTIRGVVRPVTLDVVVNAIGPHPLYPDVRKAGFSATASVRRSDFGMRALLPAIGDDVNIRIETEWTESR